MESSETLEKISQIMFETFSSPALSLQTDSVLALYGSGLTPSQPPMFPS